VFDELGPAARGATSEIEIAASQIDVLEATGVVDHVSAMKMRSVAVQADRLRVTVRVRVDLGEPGARATEPIFDAELSVPAKGTTKPANPRSLNALTSTASLKPTTDGSALAVETVVARPIGHAVASEDAGHALLLRLAGGDVSALQEIGMTNVPEGFDSTTREFSLLETGDGYVIAIGETDRSTNPHGTIVRGHTHPAETEGNARRLHKEATGFDEIVEDPRDALRAGLLPSPEDVDATGPGGRQVLATRFIDVG
jgi:hypothetical protein